MNNSQSSDCFPNSAEASFISPVPMDAVCYESLVAKTKQALSAKKEIQKPTFSTYFTALQDDCYNSICQCLELVSSLISEESVEKLAEYLNDAVTILQMFTDFIRTVIESTSMSCSMRTFPTVTGQIIFIVFVHCKDSESLYGHHLSTVEKQLKELFKRCHELQLMYLMILDKHFVFDLNDKDERDVLIEALEINLKIGEIVQSLDVKTMAEQWKAITVICEKYATTLADTNMFHDCTQVLCLLIRNNLKTTLECNQEDKVTIRSMKVASFTIKILLKICTIFKQGRRDYSNIVDLMIFQWTTILPPSECLLKELLTDEVFVQSLLNYDLESLKQEDTVIGYILTLSLAMKCLAQGSGKKSAAKTQLIQCVYKVLEYSHTWINLDIRLKSDPKETKSNTYEHLLTHTTALSLTLNNEEYNVLEKCMIEAILGTDCCSAMFCTDLWSVMGRYISPQLLFNQLIWLCTMYKKLEHHKMFQRSPQKIHLSTTITRLFEIMNKDDKMKICYQYRVHDDDNVSLWSALGVNNMPDEVRTGTEDVVFEKLNSQIRSFVGSKAHDEIYRLITLIRLAATCSFTNIRGVENFIVKAWLKTCPRHYTFRHIDNSTFWFYDYLEALVSFTDSLWLRLCERDANLIKLFHVVSSLIQSNVDLKLILTNLLCKLASSDICDNTLVNNQFIEAFSSLLQEDIVQNKLFILLSKYKNDRNVNKVLCNVPDDCLQERWSDIRSGIHLQNSKEELMKTLDSKYIHKCLESRIIELSGSSSVSMKKAESNHFDFEDDIDNLFDSEEPVPKKVKLNVSEAEAIIEKLESDVSLLCKVKENFTPNCKSRIQNVCDQLRNIIH